MKVDPKATRLGWIGTGVMGASMCGHLLSEGFQLTVFNRSSGKLRPLLEGGAVAVSSPAAVARASDIVFTIVGYPEDVREVMLSADGVLAGCRAGMVIVDMTTSEPSLAVAIAERAAALGVSSLDAPVSGGDVGAREGRLSIMIGGDEAIAKALAPCWNSFASTIVHVGGPGAGQHTKMVNQVLVASSMIGTCEALLYAHRAGLNLERVLDVVEKGAAGSWTLSNLAPRMLRGDFEPGFLVEHFQKDMGVVLAEARRMKLALPGLALVEQLYQALAAQGHGRSGTHTLILALASLSKINWQARLRSGPVG
ncbi:MAG: NAD(P)-dependent oxidoreductase [Proteobacteria bacterium]|nr:NAD(P)-dependent oxidoreductase [Pseudomonadota bacterium]